jgi:PAS domain S-box-containing protein
MNFPIAADAYLAAIISSTDDAIISKDLNGNITSWNLAAEQIFGYKADEVIGKHISIIIPPERIGEEDHIISQIRQGNRIEHFETIRRAKDGKPINISVTISPIKDENGKIIGASKIARDIGDKLKAIEAVRVANMKRDEFLANMSHELRTPMNAVIGLSNILQKMNLPPKAMECVNTLKTSADSLLDLINDLLDFAKMDSGNIQLENVEFSLPELIEAVTSITNVKAAEKGLRLFVDYAPNLNRYFVGDSLRINQILINLLSNAVKFTDSGSVELEVYGEINEDDALIKFKISDTGIGIARDKLEEIFEKFTQADASITRRYGGSGLGLTISKALVERMNGKISVKSELGVGTSFTVTLPLKCTEKNTQFENFSVKRIGNIPVQHKDVLLVEDYEPNVMVTRTLLENLGCSYDIARNGFEAMRYFVYGKYRIILMDVQMNELDGIEATRRIRRIESEKGLVYTPIIAMTAHVREQDKEKCLKAGMDDFVSKPFEFDALSKKLTYYLDREENAEQEFVGEFI